MPLSERQKKLCNDHPWDFSGLSALFLNCTLKQTPQRSHTEGLIGVAQEIFEANGVATELLRPVDYDLAPGVYRDMTEHGFETDEWPGLLEKVLAADILILGSPIWLGERSSVCSRVIERLYAVSGETNDKGQWIFYGRVGGCIITGNEDGIKHCAMGILYALQHLGFTVPPQADSGWIGEAGPGPSYLDEGSGGPENDFTNRNTSFLAWNLLHYARILRDQGGVPAHGNQRAAWDAGCRPDFPNPEHR